MKRYLDLVPISAKMHRKQSRMSVFCIVLAVFLVTAIFGMADMFIRSQIMKSQQENGNWHIAIDRISFEDAAVIAARPDIKTVSSYGVLNYRGERGYTLDGKNVIIGGSDESYSEEIFDGMVLEGAFPKKAGEALVTENAAEGMRLHIGDAFQVDEPEGKGFQFTVSGFLKNTAQMMSDDSYGIFLRLEDYCAIYPGVTDGQPDDYDIGFYIQFANTGNIRGEIAKLKAACGLSDEQVYENTKLLGLLGQSRNSFMMQIYAAAAVLAVLVLLAGILMIASSLNSNVAQRTEFFGLMRCIGATPKQVMRLVRKEALSWCRLAIPAGVLTGAIVIWILCAILRYLSPEYFDAMPVLAVSAPSLLAGALVGLLTVLLAARAPAKRAASVSPLSAVSGNANHQQPVRKAANTKLFKIDAALGIHHAKSSRKNLILMTGSFALSIILFLSFSVTIEFMEHSLTPLRPWTADLSIVSPDNTCSVPEAFLDALKENPAVDAAYGRRFAYDVPIAVSGAKKEADLISYESNQFGWAEDYLLEGSVQAVEDEANTGLTVYDSQNEIQVGDTVTLTVNGKTEKIEIVGILSDSPFHSSADTGTIICSEETFRQITGQTDYTVIDIQLTNKATDEDVNAIHRMAGSGYTFSDERMGNSSTRGTYYCFLLFIYGFLVLIALIAVFNVINSIAMSAAARTKQYGALRAIGLSNRQLSKMIIAEAAVYAVSGSIVGTALGLVCNKALFGMLVSYKWGDSWAIPGKELGVILLIMLFAVILAVRAPIRKLRGMSIVDTISAQ